METAQEREVFQLLQGRQAWPFHMMATATTTGCLPNYSSSSCSSSGGASGDCFVLGWEQQPLPPLGFYGALAADVNELFPLFAEMESSLLPVPSTLPVPPPVRDTVAATPQDLDDLLLNFWDASCHDGDVGAQQQVQAAFNSLPLPHETSSNSATTTATTTTTNSFFPCDDYDDPLSSIFSTGPAVATKALFQAPAAEPPSSSSSNCHVGPRCSDSGGAQVQCTAATPRAPPPLLPPRSSSASSLKRSTREESSDHAESSQSSKRRKTTSPAAAGVVCPFALLKPDGLDGGATLADINARILMRPTRPVRHPVGEFACAPRVSADQPGISGKAVSSFTRLHTPGRGTITIIRTRGC